MQIGSEVYTLASNSGGDWCEKANAASEPWEGILTGFSAD